MDGLNKKDLGAVIVFEIECDAGAKGSAHQAACETTMTGVRWEITGGLAKAIRAYAVAEQTK